MKVEFAGNDECPAKDTCKTSDWCVCGNYGQNGEALTGRLQFPFVPLFVPGPVNGSVQGRYICTSK